MLRFSVVLVLLASLHAPAPSHATPPAARRAASKARLSAENWTVRSHWVPATRANLSKLQRLVKDGLRAKALGNVVVMRRYKPHKQQGKQGLAVETWVRLRQADTTQPLQLPALGGKPALAGKAMRDGLRTIITQAVLSEPKRSALLDAAVKGVLDEAPSRGAEVYRRALFHAAASLGDKYSGAFSPLATVANTKRRQGKVVGIGVSLKQGSGAIEVNEAHANTPAGRALKAGDRILAINGKIPTSTTQAAQWLGGAEGTKATIVFERKGQPHEITLGRIEYRSTQVTWRPEGGALVIKLKAFRQGVAKKVADAVRRGAAEMRGAPRGVVLDLRGNGGGSVQEAVELISLFTASEKLYGTSYRQEKKYMPRAGEAIFSAMPLKILVDGRSASASEIVAGALSQAGRAQLLGDKTFGKGIQQRTYKLDDGSSLKLTNGFIEIFEDGQPNRRLRYHGKGFEPPISSRAAARLFPSAADPVLEVALRQLPR